MLVRCTSNDLRSVAAHSPLRQELGRWFDTDSNLLPLRVGGLYVLYGLHVKDGWLRYFLADEDYTATQYPLPYFPVFFDVVDRRMSRCWAVGHEYSVERPSDLLVTFTEWADEPSFYERLIDGEHEVRGIFRERREFMDLEFASPSVSDSAENVKDDWLLCSRCGDAWESNTVLGMVRCPKCTVVLLNPKYRSDACTMGGGSKDPTGGNR